MTTMQSLASQLGKLYEQRAELGYRTWKNERETEARQIELTPAEGWPGSNDKAREAYKAGAFAHDAVLVALSDERRFAQRESADLSGKIEALEAERRAAEWSIRERLIAALDRGSVQPNGRGDRADAAFDDVAQAELDRVAF